LNIRTTSPFYVVAAILLTLSSMCAEPNVGPPLFEPLGFNKGPVTFYPSLDYILTYSDNANRGDKKRSDDVLQEYLPATDMRFNSEGLISLRTTYEFGWHDYAKDEARDYLSHRANLELRMRNFMREGLTLFIDENYYQSGNSSAVDVEALSFTRFHSNTVSGRAEYATDKFVIRGRVYDTLTDYFRTSFAASDYETVGAEITGEYKLEPTHLAIFGTLAYSRTWRETTSRNDFDTYTALAGVKGSYSKLDYSVALGYTLANFINRDEDDSGPSVLTSLRYTYSPRLNFNLLASRRFQPAIQGGLTTETDVRLTAEMLLWERARLLADLVRNESDRARGGRIITTGASINFLYYLTRYASLHAGYSRFDRETTRAIPEYRINEAHVGFRFAW
jgi:hypothetical protein